MVGDGTYNEGVYSINGSKIPSGTSTVPTTIRSITTSVPRGASNVFISPSTTADGERQGIYLSGAHSYITFDGIGMDGANKANLDWPGCCGLQLDGQAGNIHHIVYKNSEFKNHKCGSWGAQGADDVTVQDNWLHGDQCNSFSHGFYANQPSTRWILTGNIIDGFVDYGMQIYICCSTNYTITKNIFRNNGHGLIGGIDANGSGIVAYGNNHLIANNVFQDNSASGVLLRGGSGTLVYNNTFYSNDEWGISNESGSSITCKNNLAIDNGSGGISNCTTSANNDTTSTAANCFVDAAGGDFSLKSTCSGAINQGAATISGATTVAYNGSLPDIGAFESLGAVTCVVANATPTLVDCAVQNNVNPPVLPASGITGFTVTGKTLSSTTRVGTNGFQATVTVGFSAGTCAVSYAQTGNFTDSALIGGGNQELFAGAATCTNNVSGGAGATVTQSHVAMYEWTGNEGSGAQIGSTNSTTAMPVMQYGKYLGRIGLKTTVADTPATNYALYYSKNAGAYAVMPTFTGSQDTGICDAPAVSNGNTVQRITSGSYVAGRVVEIGAGVPTITMTSGQSTELLYPICFGPGAALTDNFKYRIYKDDGTALAYDTNATLNVDVVSPGLSGL